MGFAAFKFKFLEGRFSIQEQLKLDFRDSSLRRAAQAEPRFDALEELIANGAIGLQNLFAVARGGGGVDCRPIFHIDRHRACEFQRLVMGFRSQRHDEVESGVFQVLD
jgi:hypothetical protein